MTPLTPATVALALSEHKLLDPEQLAELHQSLLYLYREADDLVHELVRRNWLTPYQAEQLLQGQGAKLIIGNFRILAPLGEGGMGQVFKAEQRRLGRIVALKVIHQECISKRPDAVRRFQREARAAAQMSHPNAIVIYDADQDGDTHFIVMEYAEGMDLSRLVQNTGPLPIPIACDYMAQVALALQHAHEMGMIHRDIKPSNLLVTRSALAAAKRGSSAVFQLTSHGSDPGHALPRDHAVDPGRLAQELREAGVVKILDLGLARVVQSMEAESALTLMGRVMGTPDYIAPEQARDPHNVDGRADIYSLGCTFHFLLTGNPPFPQGGALEKLLMQQLDQPTPVETLRPEVPEAIGAIIRKMMAKDPAQRFQSALEVFEALTLTADVGRSPAGFPTPTPSQAAAAVAAARLAGQTNGASTTPRRDTPRSLANWPEPSRPTPHTPEVTPPLAAEWQNLPDLPEPDNDLQPLALPVSLDWDAGVGPVAPAPPRTDNPKTLDSLADIPGTLNTLAEIPTPMIGIDDPVRPMTLNWDALQARKQEVTEVKPNDARLVALLKGHAGCVVSLAFSPNRDLLASGGIDNTVRLWDFSGSEPRELAVLQSGGEEVHALAFSFDNKMLVFGTVGGHIWFWDLTDKQPRAVDVLQGHRDGICAMAFSPDNKLLAFGAGRNLHIFDISTSEFRTWADLSGHTGDILAVAVAPDGKRFATASQDGTIRLWTPHRFWNKRQAVLQAGAPNSVAFSPDGTTLACGSRDQTVQIWDVSTDVPQRKVRYTDNRGGIRLAVFQPSGRTLVTIEDQGRASIWDLDTGTRREEWAVPFVKAYTFAFSHEGRYLATGNTDGTVLVHRVAAKRVVE